jgi:hypothetical protein
MYRLLILLVVILKKNLEPLDLNALLEKPGIYSDWK